MAKSSSSYKLKQKKAQSSNNDSNEECKTSYSIVSCVRRVGCVYHRNPLGHVPIYIYIDCLTMRVSVCLNDSFFFVLASDNPLPLELSVNVCIRASSVCESVNDVGSYLFIYWRRKAAAYARPTNNKLNFRMRNTQLYFWMNLRK